MHRRLVSCWLVGHNTFRMEASDGEVWLHAVERDAQVRHILIKPRRPMQNGYIESFNGERFRDECLNEHWFATLHQARAEIAKWRRVYNEVRLHNSIGRIPPARFAEQHRRHAGDAAQHLTPANNDIQ